MAKYYITGDVEEVKDVFPKNGKMFSYTELKEFVGEGLVGAMVEIVPLPSGKYIVVNEEGKLIGLAENRMATEEWKKEYPIEQYPNNNDELIVGNALICEANEIE